MRKELFSTTVISILLLLSACTPMPTTIIKKTINNTTTGSTLWYNNSGVTTSNQTILITNNGLKTTTKPFISVTGTWKLGLPMATLDFAPTIQEGNSFIGVYVHPKYNSSGFTTGFRFAPDYSTMTKNKYSTYLDYQTGAKIANKNETTRVYIESISRTIFNSPGGADLGWIHNDGINMGGSIAYVDFTGNARGITDYMITLNGGVSYYYNVGSGTVVQRGLRFLGFGSVSGGDSKALTSDGGKFDFLGNSYLNVTSIEMENTYTGSGKQGITRNLTIRDSGGATDCYAAFEDGLLYASSC